MTASSVFISYSSLDTPHMRAVQELLCEAGIVCVIDQDTFGFVDEWQPYAAAAIEDCLGFVAIFSENYVASDQCGFELEHARSLGRPLFAVGMDEKFMQPEGFGHFEILSAAESKTEALRATVALLRSLRSP